MKKMFVLCCILFCLSTELMPMEIAHKIGPKEDNSLIKPNNEDTQYCNLSFVWPDTVLSKKKEEVQSWAAHIAALPKDVRTIIYRDLFNTIDQIAAALAALDTKIALTSFYEAALCGHLVVEGKRLNGLELLVLPTSLRNKLISVGEGNHYEPDILSLQDLPGDIKTKLRIVTQNGGTVVDQWTKPVIHRCCACAIGGGGLLCWAVAVVTGGCHASPCWALPVGVFCLCAVVLPVSWETRNYLPCCKLPKVYTFS
jgi:hypothetical protein